MSYVDQIVKAFGGVRAMAAEIGRPPSTVHSWKDRASIPDEHKPDILAASIRLSLGLTPADFFPHSREAAE